MKTTINQLLVPHLAAGERVLWAGRPVRTGILRFLFRSAIGPAALLLVIGGLLLTGLVTVSGLPASFVPARTGAGGGVILRSFLAGAWVLCGLIAAVPALAWVRATGTVYAITDKRLFMVHRGAFRTRVRELPYEAIAWVECDSPEDGCGDLRFLLKTSWEERLGSRAAVRFASVPDPDQVRKLIEERLSDRGMRRIYDLMGPDYHDLLMKAGDGPREQGWIRNPRVGSSGKA